MGLFRLAQGVSDGKNQASGQERDAAKGKTNRPREQLQARRPAVESGAPARRRSR